jgi:peptidoglycan/LPS O-acetylase OafA/YrhL
VLAAGLCLAAAVAIWALIAGRFDDTSVRVLLTGLAAALCTLGGLAGATALARENRARRVGEVTIGVSGLALALALALIWIPDASDGETLIRALGVSGVLTLAGAHASLLLSRLSGLDTRAVHRLSQGAIVCATSAALLLSGLFAANDGPVAADIWRLLGVLVVLASLNTLLVPLVRRIARDARRRTGHRSKSSARPCT